MIVQKVSPNREKCGGLFCPTMSKSDWAPFQILLCVLTLPEIVWRGPDLQAFKLKSIPQGSKYANSICFSARIV